MKLIDQLKEDEGCKLHVYEDSRGILTAGYGHNCEAHHEGLSLYDPITIEQAESWLLSDAAEASRDVDARLPWAPNLDTVRHDILVNMAFNMGIEGLLAFHRTLAMMEAGNYDGAADVMLESQWAQEVPSRAARLSKEMKTGVA